MQVSKYRYGLPVLHTNIFNSVGDKDFIPATNKLTLEQSIDISTVCTNFTIIDDEIALERREVFKLRLNISSSNSTNARRGNIFISTVEIIDNEEGKCSHGFVYEE